VGGPGQGRANTVVMEELDVIAKIGAEGILVMATSQGVSVALKMLDGNLRATSLVGLTLLAACGAVDIPGVSSVLEKVVEPVLGGGRPWARSASAMLSRPCWTNVLLAFQGGTGGSCAPQN
jgi:L-asparaginase II